LRSSPLANNWACSRKKLLALACEYLIELFGFCFTDFGLDGVMPWSLSNRKPLSVGIEREFVCSGVYDHVQRALAGRKSMPRFELSLARWSKRILPGALREFTTKFLSLDFKFPNLRFLAISFACLLPTGNASSGRPFCAIIAMS